MATRSEVRPERALNVCDPEVAFRFADGRTARSLNELVDVAGSSPALVEQHRLHFHHWVRDVLQDPPLAADLERLGQGRLGGDRLQTELVKLVRARVQELGKRAPKGRAGSFKPR